MLDIKFIRDNADLVQKNAKDKGYEVSIAELLKQTTNVEVCNKKPMNCVKAQRYFSANERWQTC